MPENIFELSADGVSYRMLLPSAEADYIQRKLATEHAPYELPMLEDMRVRLSADDLVVDAGANIGNHTMYLAAVVRCKVAAFEPNAQLAEAIRGSLALNGLGAQVQVHELGLGKRTGRGRFAKIIPDNLGAQSIISGDGPLEITPLDSIDFPAQVKAVKIDVEGMELDVLEGAAVLIQRDRPALYVECADEASFRQVHQWMVAKNYGYWDTFNATPTHLFLPNEQITADQRLSRLQLKGAYDVYELQQQIGKTREMLGSANLKYRAANEKIISLKAELADKEVARQIAARATADAQSQLTQTSDRLEREREDLQQEVQHLSTLAESHRKAAEDAEKQLVRIEAELELTRAQVAEATAERKRAVSDTEQQAILVRELSTKLTMANGQLVAAQESLHDANRKYSAATEKVEEIRRQAEHGDAIAQQEIQRLNSIAESYRTAASEAEKQLVRIEAELEVTRSQVAEATAERKRAVSDTEQQAVLVRELSTKLTAANDQLATTQVSLHDANRKYSAATAKAEEIRREAERGDMIAQQEIQRLNSIAESYRTAASEAEKQLVRIEAELEVTRTQVAEATAERKRAVSDTEQQAVLVRELSTKLTMTNDQLVSTQDSLHDANRKCSAATEKVEEIRRKAEHGDAIALQEIQRLNTIAESYRKSANEAEKQLVRIEGELEVVRAQVAEAIAGRNRAVADTEQQAVLVRELSNKLTAANDQLASTRDSLHEVNRKYHTATEQVQEIQRKAEHERSLATLAAETAVKTNAQLIDTQSRMLEKRDALLGEVAKLRQDWQQAVHGAHQVEKQLVRVEGQLKAGKDALASANGKYREAMIQVQTLKKRIDKEEQVALRNEKLWGEAQTKMQQFKAELAKAREDHQAATQQIRALNVQIEAEKRALDTANAKYDEAATTVAALTQRIVLEEQAARGAEKLWGEAQRDVHQMKAELGKVAAGYQTATEQVDVLNTKITVEAAARNQAEQREEEARAQLTRVQLQHRVAQADLKQIKADLGQQLNEANLKYRRVSNEEIPQLKKRIQSSEEQVSTHKRELEQLKHELSTHKKTLKEANHQLERSRQQKMRAEQQVLKTRSSLSFQLGYILINGFKSFRGFIGMPGALLTWRKEAIKRRKQKTERLERLQPAIAPAARNRMPSAAPLAKMAAVPDVKVGDAVPVAPVVAMSVVAEPQQAFQHATVPQSLSRDLRQLKVATIMDEFTFGSYRSECDLFQLTPANWQAELETFKPELLFIESAWRGKDELWGSKVGHASQELQGIVAWCRQQGVPTVFWNKEDPVHFETFLSTAMLFDCVFTTDIDCIHRYKAALKHDNVFLLPFACQPKNNHPIETYERKDAFCFAGAYYVRYPDRTRDLGNFISELPSFRPVEIYDRNYGKEDPNYQFPPEYQPYIVGTLPFDQIDKAYKGYRYAINLNSIKQSQTMFARRVFELMASNTITVSNFSRGIRLMFGDLVITTDSGHEMVRHLEAVAGDDVRSAKLRLAALRKVLQEHTYEQRLAYVFSKVSGKPAEVRQPAIAVLAYAATQAQLDQVLANATRQTYANCRVTVLLAKDFVPAARADTRARLIPHAEAAGLSIGIIAQGADFVAGMAAKDYYGPNYLLDIALATTYSDAEVIGKNAQYVLSAGTVELRAAGTAYHPAQRLALRSAAVRLARVAEADVATWLDALESAAIDTMSGLAIDEFNYCLNGQEGPGRELVTATVDDLQGLDTGVALAELLRLAEGIPPAAAGGEKGSVISGKRLSEAFKKSPSAAVKTELDVDNWCFQSSLPDGKHEYLYATAEFTLDDLGWTDKAEFYFDMTPGLNLQLVLVFLDAQKQKISHVIKHPNRNQDAEIPLGTAHVRLGLRIYAGGSCDIKGLVLGHRDLQPAEIIGKADRLVLTNHYPSYEDLYRNGFVHSRVAAYRERGVDCDVFRLRPEEPVSYHEFEDVDVITGSQKALSQMLASGKYRSVLVHFLDPTMWEVLQHYVDRIKVVVWVHGAEIQPWHRRDFGFSTDEELAVAKMKSDARMSFWKSLLQDIPVNLRLVFVSRYFAEEVMTDLGFRIPENHYSIIHNPINTDLFAYQEKNAEQRMKVLSIRSFASPKYANDLTVEAIRLLAAEPWFNEMEFRIVGDGTLFDQTVEPVRQYPNVHIERRFLKQTEIAEMQRDYGILLTPTRWDSQGVSRDEAMASGLVPATNAVSAVPEFVDESCAILAPENDAAMLARGITKLYHDPALFLAMSRAASENVNRKRRKGEVILSEIGIMS